MKNIKIISKLAIIAIISFTGVFPSCKEEVVLELPYLFRPINFNAELNKTIATISWAAVDSATSYTLQVCEDSLFTNNLVDTTITGLSFVKEFAGETQFFARVRANAEDSNKNSKFNALLAFKTPKENLFEGFGTKNNTGKVYSAYMTDVKMLTIKWMPGSNVTHLILTSDDGATRDSVVISGTEATTGEKNVSLISNSKWTIKILNNKIVRGTTTGVIEGDVILNSGEDLPTAISNATDGQVIVLASGVVFPMGGGTYRFGKNIKIRGFSVLNRPVICMTSGTPSSTSSMLGFVDASSLDFVKFENIDFTGYCDNSTSGTKIGYLFNNNLITNVKSLSFTNCNMHNFGNTPMRVQGNKNQVIDTLNFNGCVINDIGFSSTYAIVNSNSADLINNIYFNNCTFYNFKGSLILRTGVYTMGTVSITNCTVNQGMQDGGSARYLIDANNVTIANGITIKNCIFGSTGAAMGANGVRKTLTTTLTNTGSYFTTDYVDDPIPIPPGAISTSIKSSMTPYPGVSTSLWTDPATVSTPDKIDYHPGGIFTLKDTTFPGKGTAGDLRWY